MAKLKKKISYEFDKMTADGFSFCLIPCIILNRVKYSKEDIGYSINFSWFVWLITIKYDI